MDHIEAHELVSARLDGELPSDRVQALDVHLASCEACRAFADGATRLRALTAELPREEPGELFARRGARERHRRPLLRLAPALAAVLAVTLFFVLGAPPGFKVPVADAARALTTIRTFYAERVITQQGEGSSGTIRERVWFQAPGYVRIERKSSKALEIIIKRPGEQYEEGPDGFIRTTGLPPDVNDLPEPLSPTIALLGSLAGPGPDVGGRATVRYVLDLGDGRSRTADVDAERYTALGITESLVLSKSATIDGEATGRKRVVDVRINEPIDASLFNIPDVEADDAGFRPSTSRLPIDPLRQPEGFRLAQTSVGPDSTRALYTRGSFEFQVDIATRATGGDDFTAKTVPVRIIDGHEATIVEDLYKLPSITFELEHRIVTITGPMTPEGLVETARTMFLS